MTLGANETTFVQGTSNRDGSIVRFVTGLLDSYGLPWVEKQITPESRRYSPGSSFTACVVRACVPCGILPTRSAAWQQLLTPVLTPLLAPPKSLCVELG